MTKKHPSTQRPPQPRQVKKMNNSLTTFMVLAVLGVAIVMILLLGVPIVLAGTFAGVLAGMLAAGRWSNVIEKASGVIVIAVGLYLLWIA